MVKEKLERLNQQHLLKFEKDLSSEEIDKLHAQIAQLDFSYLDALKEEKMQNVEITPIKAMTVEQIELQKERFEKIGIESLAKQEVCVLMLAGGMGTRLGSDKPKGMFNIGKTKTIYIFQRLIENLLEVVKRCGKMVPLFIMTSDKNNEETIAFFEEKQYFGYDKNYVKFFVQEMAPCVDLEGKVLLEEKGKVATSPNGNGGWFSSLLACKEAKEMFDKFDLKWLNVFSVDNVLQKMADPVFVGATIDGGFEVGSKVIRKADAHEKVGVMCNKNGRPSVIEYIDMTEEMATETDEKGERVYDFGVILNYLFSVELLYQIKDNKLPIHVVTKKVEYINDSGEKVVPEKPNAHKFEMLCVDMVELSPNCLPFEVVREKEFAPVKNKEGVDSVETAQKLLKLNGFIL